MRTSGQQSSNDAGLGAGAIAASAFRQCDEFALLHAIQRRSVIPYEHSSIIIHFHKRLEIYWNDGRQPHLNLELEHQIQQSQHKYQRRNHSQSLGNNDPFVPMILLLTAYVRTWNCPDGTWRFPVRAFPLIQGVSTHKRSNPHL